MHPGSMDSKDGYNRTYTLDYFLATQHHILQLVEDLRIRRKSREFPNVWAIAASLLLFRTSLSFPLLIYYHLLIGPYSENLSAAKSQHRSSKV